jgi:ABC-type thiamine transport system ATPase subunit
MRIGSSSVNWCFLRVLRCAGKTTLLRLVAGLELPTGGKIYFDDLDATDLAVQDRQVGLKQTKNCKST